jgi:hypothetical protein
MSIATARCVKRSVALAAETAQQESHITAIGEFSTTFKAPV